MSYSSCWYLLVFLTIVFIVYTAMPKKLKWTVLLTASLAFYAISSRYLLLILACTALSVYLTGLCLGKIQEGFDIAKPSLEKADRKLLKQKLLWQKKFVVALAVIFNVGLLAFLKYYNFFAGQGNGLLALLGVSSIFPTLKLLLPLGISFYTLSAVSYVIDVYRGKYKAETNFGHILLFLSFFPVITEGPISRYDQLGGQLSEGHSFNYDDTLRGILLILWGCVKKIVIADRAAELPNTVFGKSDEYSGIVVVAAMLVYTLQLYADFSGCIDIATGSAKLFGIDLAPNFKRPFFSKSVSDFWRRWHISLGTWFKDYVFYPVSLSAGFNRLSKATMKRMNKFFGALVPAAAALFVVWFCTGIWHGASWKYIVYGLYYFVLILLGMLFEPVTVRLLKLLHINREGKLFGAFRMLRTFVLVNIGMLIFRADDLKAFGRMFISMFSGSSVGIILDGSFFDVALDKHDCLVLALGVIAMLVVGILQERGINVRDRVVEGKLPLRWAVFIVLIMSIVILGAYGANYAPVDFLYAQF